MGTTDQKKKEGEKILENYKRQLADRMAREKIAQQALQTQNSVAGSKRTKGSNEEFRMKRL